MNISNEAVREAVLADATQLGTFDETSIQILAIGRVAQAALASEVEALTSRGAFTDEVATYRAERGAQLDRWLHLQCEAARMRTIVREEAERAA